MKKKKKKKKKIKADDTMIPHIGVGAAPKLGSECNHYQKRVGSFDSLSALYLLLLLLVVYI